MLFAWMQNLIGQWGMALLKVYEANSLWLNLIVLAYGAWIVLSWVNLKNIRSLLVKALVEQMRAQAALDQKEAPALVIPWESAVGRARFPYIAQQSALAPRRLSVQAVQAMLPVEDLAAEALRVLKYQEHRTRAARNTRTGGNIDSR